MKPLIITAVFLLFFFTACGSHDTYTPSAEPEYIPADIYYENEEPEYIPAEIYHENEEPEYTPADIYHPQTESTGTIYLPVLLYHHILPDALNTNHRENASVISLENFEEQMSYLYRNNFTAITLTQLENFLFNGAPLPERSVMIHFDDGYYSNFVYAMPILERYGFIAQLFLIGRPIYRLGDTQPPMDHAGLTFTAASTIEGTEHVFETANHTFAKHHLADGTNLSAFVYYDRDTIIADLTRGFDFVNDRRAFAYPRGQHSAETIEILEYLGITMAFTTQSGYVTRDSDNMLLPRFIIFPSFTLGQFSDIVNGNA